METSSNFVSGERAPAMERLIRRYFDACNDADIDAIAACFTEDAVHYFPPGMYGGPFRGARTIAQRWCDAVNTLGSYWTVDRLVIVPGSWEAVMEWSHFKTKRGQMLRGIEWYEHDPASGLIREIRAYYATPQPQDGPGFELRGFELGGFDYAARGYKMGPPEGARPAPASPQERQK
jgi:SnoaL-like domain